jgi:hypothetical protein
MSRKGGVWIDHQRAVIVFASEAGVTTTTVESGVEGHPRYSGQQDSGGEKKYEERHRQSLARYYDQVIDRLGEPDALLVFGPGEAKLELKERLRHSMARLQAVEIEAADTLTDAQIVARVKEHFRSAITTS